MIAWLNVMFAQVENESFRKGSPKVRGILDQQKKMSMALGREGTKQLGAPVRSWSLTAAGTSYEWVRQQSPCALNMCWGVKQTRYGIWEYDMSKSCSVIMASKQGEKTATTYTTCETESTKALEGHMGKEESQQCQTSIKCIQDSRLATVSHV